VPDNSLKPHSSRACCSGLTRGLCGAAPAGVKFEACDDHATTRERGILQKPAFLGYSTIGRAVHDQLAAAGNTIHVFDRVLDRRDDIIDKHLAGIWSRETGGTVAGLRFHNDYGPAAACSAAERVRR
jgi:hypothetical protein